MNTNDFKRLLRAKERELWAEMTRTETEARDASAVTDQDAAFAAEAKEGVFQETTAEWKVFTQVREALRRLEQGSFGKCVDCGRQIENHRLESVPWTAYCLNHQDQHEQELAEPTS